VEVLVGFTIIHGFDSSRLTVRPTRLLAGQTLVLCFMHEKLQKGAGKILEDSGTSLFPTLPGSLISGTISGTNSRTLRQGNERRWQVKTTATL